MIEFISPNDLKQHLLMLDDEARHSRFGFGASDASISAYCGNISSPGFILGVKKGHIIVAAAHVATTGHEAELGVSVLSNYRRQNLATKLICSSWDILSVMGYDKLFMVCLPTNNALLSLVKKIGADCIEQDPVGKRASIILKGKKNETI